MTVKSVSLGEIQVSKDPEDMLVCYGLGSCVAVCAYDRINKIGGVYHCVLPGSGSKPGDAKYADVGLPLLIAKMENIGAMRFGLSVKLCGGAKILNFTSELLDIGTRNTVSIKGLLRDYGIKIAAEDVGGCKSRTARFSIVDGSLTVKSAFAGEKIL